MNGKRSREALLEFLDYLARKGLMNKTTVSSRKAAANRILDILDDQEAEDITALDLDDVLLRFSNIAGANYTPDSLNTYKSRLKSAIEDFKSYLDNPMGFRPSISTNSRKAGTERTKAAPSVEETSGTSRRQSRVSSIFSAAPAASVSILPIPIRSDLTVHIQGLPYDLTAAEAAKIANVVRAMASTE